MGVFPLASAVCSAFMPAARPGISPANVSFCSGSPPRVDALAWNEPRSRRVEATQEGASEDRGQKRKEEEREERRQMLMPGWEAARPLSKHVAVNTV